MQDCIVALRPPGQWLGTSSAAAMSAFVAMLAGPAAAQRVGPTDTTPPSIEYGPLCPAVELSGVFPDSKTFPDLIPSEAPAAA